MDEITTTFFESILSYGVIALVIGIILTVAPIVIWFYCKKIHDTTLDMFNAMYAIIKNQEKQLMQQQILINKLINK